MRSITKPLLLLLVVLLATLAACGEPQKVGSEGLLEFDEQQRGGPRLGERTAAPTGTPGSLTVGQTAKPTAAPTATPAPEYFEVGLIPNSPYYEPGNRIVIRVGVTIRVTNEDGTTERSKGRSFTDKNGTFHSGLLKPGQTWTWTFRVPARYEIIDEGLTFATAVLEVVP